TTLIAIFSFRLIELPFWKGWLSQFAPHKVIFASLVVMALVTKKENSLSNNEQSPVQVVDVSSQWRSDLPVIYTLGCDKSYKDARVLPCIFGRHDAKKTVVLLGDSIGAQWFSIFPNQ
ncbi:MAG: hypothetical protein RIS64_3580, partial [Bacteroidota bacterium]